MNNEMIGKLAIYLLDKTGSIFGCIAEPMSAKVQRELFGTYFGKGFIVIDGMNETVCNRVKVCFGLDSDDRNITRWVNL